MGQLKYCFALCSIVLMGWGNGFVYSQGVWSQLSPMPNAAGFMGSVVYNGKIYFFGGAPTIESSFSKAYMYDPVGESWTPLPNLPQSTCGAGVVELGGKIYVIGGGNAPLGTYYKTVYVFDPVSLTWGTAASLPAERSLFATSVLNGKIYVMGGGGSSGEILKSVEIYDPVNNSWTPGPDMPNARAFVTSAVVNDQIYVLGGLNAASAFGLDVVDVFNPATGWSTGKPMPTGRWGAAASAIGGKIFAFGGSAWDTPTAEFATVEMYNPADESWLPVAPMPTARRTLSALAFGGKILTFGGIIGFTGQGVSLNVVEQFDPEGLIDPTRETGLQFGTRLVQNTPNPFSDATNFHFYLAEAGDVQLSLYDNYGRLLQTIVQQFLMPGDYTFPFSGDILPQGVYFAQLRVNNVEIGAIKIASVVQQ